MIKIDNNKKELFKIMDELSENIDDYVENYMTDNDY